MLTLRLGKHVPSAGGHSILNKKEEQDIPDMSQVDFEDRVKILMGVAPEGEEVIVHQDEEQEG